MMEKMEKHLLFLLAKMVFGLLIIKKQIKKHKVKKEITEKMEKHQLFLLAKMAFGLLIMKKRIKKPSERMELLLK